MKSVVGIWPEELTDFQVFLNGFSYQKTPS